MTFAQYYYYLFYQVSLFFDKMPNPWPVEGDENVKKRRGAISFMDALVFCWVLSALLYAHAFVGLSLPFSSEVLTVGLIVLVYGGNFYILSYKKNWTRHENEFVRWPMEKNRKGGWIVLVVILLSLINLIVAYKIVFWDE